MIEHVYEHRVRYRECDPMGVVYHTHYVDLFEYARTEALRDLGVSYKSLEDDGVMMPVVNLHVRYHRPARYDDLLHVYTRFADVPAVRVPIDYEVRRADEDTVLVTGSVILCFVDAETRRPRPAPPHVQALFEEAMAK